MQVAAGQLRRWHNSPGSVGAWRSGKMFIVLSQRKTFADVDLFDDLAHLPRLLLVRGEREVRDLAWNYLGDCGEEWQWDDVLVGSSEVVSD